MKKLIPIILISIGTALPMKAGLVEQLFYDNIEGVDVQDLRNAPNFPDAPDFSSPLEGGLTTPDGNEQGDNYGSLVRGYFQAPDTGEFTFYIRSDDAGEFWVSTDHDPSNIVLIGQETGCCAPLFSGDRLADRSGTLSLERGAIHYFEAIYKEGGGGDYLQIGWEKPDGTQEIIPRGQLFPFDRSGGAGAPIIDFSPFDASATEAVDVQFYADVSGAQPMTFEWFKNGIKISGADLATLTVESPTLADDFSTYSVKATNSDGSMESFPANLFVLADINPPEVTLVEAGLIDPNQITITFSEKVSQSSAENPSNYSVNKGASVDSATLSGDGFQAVVSATGILDSNTGYTLTVTGVQDLAASPNSIASTTSEIVLFPGGLVQDSLGFVVFEAENFDEIVGEEFWTEDMSRGNPSNGSAMVVENGAGGGESSAQLLYEVNFNQTGEMIVWYHASGPSGTDDSGWLHIDGARPPERADGNSASMTGFNGAADYEWNSNSQAGPDPMTFQLDTAGPHIFGLARREDGSFFDKFIITTDPNYNPTTGDDGINREETRAAGDPLPNPEIVITQHPQDADGFANRQTTFTVAADVTSNGEPAGSVLVHWIEDGEVIAGVGGFSYTTPPLKASDDGKQIQALVRMPGLRTLSEAATLSVVPIAVESQSPGFGQNGVPVDLGEITVVFGDGDGLTVETVSLTLDGNSVDTTSSKSDGATTVTHSIDGLLPQDTVFEAAYSVETAEGASITYVTSFTTEAGVATVPAALASPLGTGSTSGFTVRSVQASVDAGLSNNIARGEAQLADPPNPPAEHEGSDTPLVINYNQDDGGSAGFFDSDTGLQTVGLMGNHTDQTAMEIQTFLEFTEAGVVRMGVNSDDGFLATVSRVHGDSLADSVQVGAHDGGGGATGADPQYPFAFVIEEPGVYAFRMTWWEGTGGANVEWASKDGAGVSHLVNDTASGSPIRAYRTRSEDPPPPPAGVLLVVSSNGANESDLALKADLESRGAIVSVVLADQSIPADAEGRLFVVVSSTVGSGDVTEKFRNATVPVITWEQALQDDFGLTQNDGAFRGTAGSQTSINIVDPDHPLAGGLSAGVHEVSSPSGYSWGIPDPAVDANIVATLVDNPDAAIVYEVPQGGSLIDGTPAAGQRIHIFFSDSTFLALNSDGYAIWNAVIQSAGPTLDDPPAAPIEPPYVVNPEDALNIAFVSFHADSEVPTPDAAAAGFGTASDKIYTDLLVATGHTVTRVVTSNSPDVDALNQFDLVIISRAVSSGHYSNEGATAWTSVTTPSLILGGYVLRTSRMGFTTGTSMVDSTDTITLNVNNPGHPIFNGVALDANGTMVNDFAEIITFGDTVQRGVSVNNNEAGAGGQVLATVANTADPTSGGLVIGEWQTGAVMENGNSDVLGGLRVVLLTGSREQGFTSQGAGIYDLVGDGALLFLNAVGYTGGILNGGGGDQPSISISTDTDGNTVLTFSGTLRGADDADGPYLEVTGAVSPMTITPDAVRKFYQTSN